MALGGGTFTVQNKILPGRYIKIISAADTSPAITQRGVAAIGLSFSWGDEDKIIELTLSDFMKNSLKLFGCAYTDTSLTGLRDIFKHASKVYVKRLNTGTKASNTFAEALYNGVLGNSLKTVIEINVDDGEKYDVKTFFETSLIDSQTVASASDLTDNDFVVFNKEAELTATAGTALSGGTDIDCDINSHITFLNLIERYSVNAVGVVSETAAVNELYVEWAKDIKYNKGINLQIVAYHTAADSELVLNVKNCKELVYWVLGVAAGTDVNKSALNMAYDGEFEIPASYTQTQLEDAILNGEFALHFVGDTLKVLDDINSLVTFTEEKNEIFRYNKTIRVTDRISDDISAVWAEKYLGKINNNTAGRESLWGDIVTILSSLKELGAIDEFDEDSIIISQGEHRDSVTVTTAVTIPGTMGILYLTCIIS